MIRNLIESNRIELEQSIWGLDSNSERNRSSSQGYKNYNGRKFKNYD